jgi:hypothetical protein
MTRSKLKLPGCSGCHPGVQSSHYLWTLQAMVPEVGVELQTALLALQVADSWLLRMPSLPLLP